MPNIYALTPQIDPLLAGPENRNNELLTIVPTRHLVQPEHILMAMMDNLKVINESWALIKELDKLAENNFDEYRDWFMDAYRNPVEIPVVAPFTDTVMVKATEKDVHFIPPSKWQDNLEAEPAKPHHHHTHKLG